MIEKTERLGLKLEDGFIYDVRADGIWRVPAKEDSEGNLNPIDGNPEQRVSEAKWELDDRYFYFMDNDGDAARARLIPYAGESGERRLPPLTDSSPSRTVNPAPGRFWLVPLDYDDVDADSVPDETVSCTVEEKVAHLKAGDGVFLWLSKPYQCLVSLLEVNELQEAKRGTTAFEGRFLTHSFEAPQYRDELIDDEVLARAPFLSSKYKGNVVELRADHAQRLAERIKRANPVVAPVVDAWIAALSSRVNAEPAASLEQPEPEEAEELGQFIEANVIEPGKEYRILSVQPPWAWSIIFAGKDVENRSWTTPYRGTILIHASSKKFTGQALEDTRREIAQCSGIDLAKVPTEFPRSQILGLVDIVECVANSRSPWAIRGEEHWILRRPRPLERPVLNVEGKLNLWKWTVP